MKRIILGFLAVVFLAFVSFATVMYSSYSPGAPVYVPAGPTRAMLLPLRLRTRDEHDQVRAGIGNAPYVLQLAAGKGSVVFYGAHHTRDPHDPHMGDISTRWRDFRPTVALYEGRQRSFFDTSLLDPVKGKTEAEMLHQLAMADAVPVYTLEPEYRDEVRQMLDRWGAERVALFYFTRVYWSEAGGRADEKLAVELLAKRTDVDGLRGSLASLADVDRVWKREFGGQPDWRTMKSEPAGTIFDAMSDDSRRIRGEHMVRAIVDLVRRGERVFAVVGSGNVIRTEWMLREALGAPAAADQPRS